MKKIIISVTLLSLVSACAIPGYLPVGNETYYTHESGAGVSVGYASNANGSRVFLLNAQQLLARDATAQLAPIGFKPVKASDVAHNGRGPSSAPFCKATISFDGDLILQSDTICWKGDEKFQSKGPIAPFIRLVLDEVKVS